MLSTSLKPSSEMFAATGVLSDASAFSNYIRAWKEANIGRYFINTLIVTVGWEMW